MKSAKGGTCDKAKERGPMRPQSFKTKVPAQGRVTAFSKKEPRSYKTHNKMGGKGQKKMPFGTGETS